MSAQLSTGNLQLSPLFAGKSGDCYFRGNLLMISRVNLGPRTSSSLSYGLFKLEVAHNHYKGGLKRTTCSSNYRVSCVQKIDFCYNSLDLSKGADRYHIGRQLYLQKTSLRHIAVRSDIARSGAPDAASSLSELHVGPKVRGFCFYSVTAVVAIFLFVMMVVGHPFVLLLDRYRRRAHHFIAKLWATCTISPFMKVEIEGLEHMPASDTAAVYVSNHQSFLDIYALLTLGRSFKFISKTSIFLYPIIGWAMYLMGVIPLKRMDNRSQLDCLKRCMDLIRGGASVFFFPEGTRSKDGKLGAFKKGAFSVAAKTGVPVVPMTLMGTGNIMPTGQEGLLYPGTVKVVVHPNLIGTNAEELCSQARSVIACTLDQQG